jgi:NAD(P)-dependent dehydrogenase (short-subunit alcohol dehydrogenase family)
MPAATNIDLTDQVAVVTGSGAGIGQGIAAELASRGADVVIVEIDPVRADETAALVAAHGRRAVIAITDCLETDQIRAAIQRADDELGRIDIVVNNVGGVTAHRFIEQSERSWRRHIELNMVSMLCATSSAVPIMIRGGRGGSIVNVTSIEGSRACPDHAVYAACKAGMISFTRSMAVELGEHGIRVNAIAPDMTLTPGTLSLSPGADLGDHQPSARWLEAVAAYNPLGRPGVVEECGQLVAFLSSSLASYITGAIIPVDGGTWASSGWNRTTDGRWGLFGRDPMVG